MASINGHLAQRVHIFDNHTALGAAAAEIAADLIRRTVDEKGACSVMLAAAPSQDPTLTALLSRADVPWDAVRFFHMDEYLGLAADAPQLFGNWLEQRLRVVQYEAFETFNSEAEDPDSERQRYEELLRSVGTFDLTLLGVGVNGHIAFNEPGDTDFEDSRLVRLVNLDEVSRRQQVDEGLFAALDEVPKQALTVTVSALMKSKAWLMSVLGAAKASAVLELVTGPVTERCPASAIKLHADAHLFLDEHAASLLVAESR